MARRVLLHVGCPKTGTSFLQGVLWDNLEVLAAQGLVVPLTYNHHYRTSLFVRDVWRTRPAAAEIEESWQELRQAVRDADGDVLVTHESLAAATSEQARRLIDALDGAETHVVVTARDLVRQLPAEWQQSVKQGREHRLDEFAQDVVDRGPRARWFWQVQDVPDIIERWSSGLSRDQVHVVTVPRTSGRPTELWARFASVLGVDPDSVELQQARGNESLGAVEIELLRRVNQARDDRFPVRGNQRWFKDLLANDLLAARPDKQRFAVGPQVHEQMCTAARLMADRVRDAGCHLVGDVDDLVPGAATVDGVDPGTVGDPALLRAATGTLLDLLDLHRSRVEALEHWRDLAVWRGDRVAELEQRVEELERSALRARARRALGRILARTLGRTLSGARGKPR